MFRHLRFRTHAVSSLLLPLNVRSAGHYLMESRRQETRESGSFIQMFWCLRGSGKISLGRKRISFRQGSVFFYHPGENHRIESGRAPLEYRWLTLDGSHGGTMLQRFGLHRIQHPGLCPENLFDQLDPCLLDATAEGERNASILAYEILLRAASSGGEKTFPGDQIHSTLPAKAWLEKHFMDARLNITQLSSRFHIHRSTLYRIFMKQHGVSPIQYLNRLRLRHAIGLLNDSNLPVADVAVKAGIPDIAYFSRLIRKNTGFSPRAYRQSHGIRKHPPSDPVREKSQRTQKK